MVFGYETGTINVIVPDNVRFSSTLIFFTELILVFSSIFIVSVLGMASIQQLLNATLFHKESQSQQHKRQLLLIPVLSNEDTSNTPSTNNIFTKTINKTKNITIWSYLVFITSLITTVYYLLIFTNVITPSTNFNCTNFLQIGNALLIMSRYTLYFYWNELLLYSTSVYFAHYVINNTLFKQQYPDLKPIKSLPTYKKQMSHLQHNLDQHIHNRYSDGEQYLYYKIFYKYYIYRVLLTAWIAVYVIGLLIYTKGETYTLTVDSNPQDEDGLACKEVFDTESVGMVFYTFGVCCDLLTILYMIDAYILSLSNNLLTILEDDVSLNKNVFILIDMRKNVTLAMISLWCTLIFRVLSFATGLEATLYPLGYTVNILMVFLVFRFNQTTYSRCCGNRTETACFCISFNLSKCWCRYKYEQSNLKVINSKLNDIKEAKEQQAFELEVNASDYKF